MATRPSWVSCFICRRRGETAQSESTHVFHQLPSRQSALFLREPNTTSIPARRQVHPLYSRLSLALSSLLVSVSQFFYSRDECAAQERGVSSLMHDLSCT
ncbi:hypothetical protein CPC08DRAFT_397398 [Agrocybe pediades]|nr:hypothetical protein CPC08DRAFT_397398 [Agrocybe pediades]